MSGVPDDAQVESVHQSFNDALKNFVVDLTGAFPKEPALQTFLSTFDAVVMLDETAPARSFMEAIEPHAHLARARDPRLFDVLKVADIDFQRMWNSGISDGTKKAIWEHIGVLLFTGTLIRSIPPDVMPAIETLSRKVQSGELNIASLMPMFLSTVGGDGSGPLGALGALGALGGMGGGAPPFASALLGQGGPFGSLGGMAGNQGNAPGPSAHAPGPSAHAHGPSAHARGHGPSKKAHKRPKK